MKNYNKVLIKEGNFLDPELKKLSDEKMAEWRVWFDNRLDNAIEAAETQNNPQIESKFLKGNAAQIKAMHQRKFKNDENNFKFNLFYFPIFLFSSIYLDSFERLSEIISDIYGGKYFIVLYRS